jgi:hypothetical protein
MSRIEIRTKLLRAIAACAYSDPDRPRIAGILFRDGRIVASNGHVLVVVPLQHELTLMVPTHLAVVACDAQVANDDGQVDEYGFPVVNDNRCFVYADGEDAVIDIGGVVLRAPALDASTYPDITKVSPNSTSNGNSVGVLYDPRLLALAGPLLDAHEGRNGLELVACGGLSDALVFRSEGGIEFTQMPMRKAGPL